MHLRDVREVRVDRVHGGEGQAHAHEARQVPGEDRPGLFGVAQEPLRVAVRDGLKGRDAVHDHHEKEDQYGGLPGGARQHALGSRGRLGVDPSGEAAARGLTELIEVGTGEAQQHGQEDDRPDEPREHLHAHLTPEGIHQARFQRFRRNPRAHPADALVLRRHDGGHHRAAHLVLTDHDVAVVLDEGRELEHLVGRLARFAKLPAPGFHQGDREARSLRRVLKELVHPSVVVDALPESDARRQRLAEGLDRHACGGRHVRPEFLFERRPKERVVDDHAHEEDHKPPGQREADRRAPAFAVALTLAVQLPLHRGRLPGGRHAVVARLGFGRALQRRKPFLRGRAQGFGRILRCAGARFKFGHDGLASAREAWPRRGRRAADGRVFGGWRAAAGGGGCALRSAAAVGIR